MLQLAKRLLSRSYEPLNTVSISKHNLLHNYRVLNQCNRSLKIAPVVKSNAYGHGLSLIGPLIDELHPPFMCVDSIYEAYELWNRGVKTPILIMGFVHPDNLKMKKLPFMYAVWDADILNQIASYQPDATFHLFVDTGMHREGLYVNNLLSFVNKIKKHQKRIVGVMSHFANAQSKKSTVLQLKLFKKALHILEGQDIRPRYVHIAASGGLLYSHNFHAFNLGNIARTGLALYGFHPDDKKTTLKPVLQLSSTLIQIKNIKRGEQIGYDYTYTATHDMIVGILPIGYNDGVDRRLSNTGKVLIGKTLCPIVGKVSMNITVVDITKVRKPRIGQSTIIFSSNAKMNTIGEAAKQCNTIPYELLIHINPKIHRLISTNQ